MAGETCHVPAMPSSFHSVVVDVEDFDSAAGDYARLLGQSATWLESNADRGTRSALFPLSNMILEIRAAKSGAATDRLGLAGFRLGCDDLETLTQRLADREISLRPSVSEKAEASDGSVRTWASTLVDPAASRSLARP